MPPYDPRRQLVLVKPDENASLRHIGLVGDTYTILLTAVDTGGRYCLIDTHVLPGGGPPLHRHDFEEMFTVLDGDIEATFRGKKVVVPTGQTINIPSNAPHAFANASDKPARLLCVCSPPGLEEFFMAVGVPVGSRTTPPPKPSKAEQEAFLKKAKTLSPKYRMELLKP